MSTSLTLPGIFFVEKVEKIWFRIFVKREKAKLRIDVKWEDFPKEENTAQSFGDLEYNTIFHSFINDEFDKIKVNVSRIPRSDRERSVLENLKKTDNLKYKAAFVIKKKHPRRTFTKIIDELNAEKPRKASSEGSRKTLDATANKSGFLSMTFVGSDSSDDE